jgi:hypothetical protein
MAEGESSGRTRWSRFVAVFKVSASTLTGKGFVQFGGVDAGSGQAHAVAVNGFRTATLDKFCQSVFVPGVPLVGDVTMRITAADVGGMYAENLVVNLTDLTGDLTLDNPQNGVDAGAVTEKGPGPAGLKGQAGGFGLQADNATITGLKQTAWSTTAQTIKFTGMGLTVRQGRQECF